MPFLEQLGQVQGQSFRSSSFLHFAIYLIIPLQQTQGVDAKKREEYLKGGYGRRTIKNMLRSYIIR